MNGKLYAECPKCGERCSANVRNDILTDDDYIFFACDECGTEFFVHTTIEIEERDTKLNQADKINDERRDQA